MGNCCSADGKSNNDFDVKKAGGAKQAKGKTTEDDNKLSSGFFILPPKRYETQPEFDDEPDSDFDSSVKRVYKAPLDVPEGGKFEGFWNQQTNMRDGIGLCVWSDNSVYHGYWRSDKPNGKGMKIYPDTDVYIGNFVDGKMEGYGEYYDYEGESSERANAQKYEGEFENNLQHGTGKQVWKDGSSYEGEWKYGKKEGEGYFEWKDGSWYRGEFKNDKFDGKGVYEWANGRKYDGEWNNGLMHGDGEYIWEDGKSYKGEFKNDKRHGYGEFIWPSGKAYKGNWKNGKMHGNGELIKDGNSVSGTWENGKKI